MQWPVEEINKLHNKQVSILHKILDCGSVFEVQGITASQVNSQIPPTTKKKKKKKNEVIVKSECCYHLALVMVITIMLTYIFFQVPSLSLLSLYGRLKFVHCYNCCFICEKADIEILFEVPELQDAEFLNPTGVDPQLLCTDANASVKGRLGPFGVLAFATKDLTEQTAIFFRIFKGHNGYVVLMCSDQSRFTFSPFYFPFYKAKCRTSLQCHII